MAGAAWIARLSCWLLPFLSAGLAASGLYPSMEERPDELTEVVGGAVVGVVGAGHHRQLTQRGELGGGRCPRHGHDRLAAAPAHEHRHPDQRELVLDRVAEGMDQG